MPLEKRKEGKDFLIEKLMNIKLHNSIAGRLLILLVSSGLIVWLPFLVAKIPIVNKIAANRWPYIMNNPDFITSYGIGILAIFIPAIFLFIAFVIIAWVITGYK